MFKRRHSLFSPGPVGTIFAMIALITWALVVLFPLYWIFITSFKLPIDVFRGPFYIPFVDFKPSLDAWHYVLLGDLQRDTFRPYLSTIVVSISSTILALVFGTAAAYALTRFTYRPKLGAVGIFIGCLLLVIAAVSFGAPWLLAVVAGLALFFILLQTVARRFKRSLGNNDIAFWMITQRILPPVAVVIPIYIFYSMFGFQRTGDSIWAAADQMARGFLVGATAGRTTLTPADAAAARGETRLAVGAPLAAFSSAGPRLGAPLPAGAPPPARAPPQGGGFFIRASPPTGPI